MIISSGGDINVTANPGAEMHVAKRASYPDVILAGSLTRRVRPSGSWPLMGVLEGGWKFEPTVDEEVVEECASEGIRLSLVRSNCIRD